MNEIILWFKEHWVTVLAIVAVVSVIIYLIKIGIESSELAEQRLKPVEVSNPDYDLKLLFSFAEYSVLRFYDGGYARYIVVTTDKIKTLFSDIHNQGKTTYEDPQEIQTIE